MRRLVVVLLIAVLGGLLLYALTRSGTGVPDSSVLVLELGGTIEEAPPLDALEQFFAQGPALPTLVLQLEKAAVDERVRAVLLHIRALEAGLATIHELRDAVRRVRDAGKPVVALLDLATLNATRELFLASAADRVYVVPGFLGPFAGIAGQLLALGGFFEKLGVDVEYARVGRYKSAPETFGDRNLSPETRAVFNELLDGLFDQIVKGVAEGRDLDDAEVRRLIERAPGNADEYVDAGLADGVAGREEVLERDGLKDVEELLFEDYAEIDPRKVGLRNGPKVALIFGEGAVVQRADRGPRSRDFDSEAIGKALDDAAEDSDIRAIVLRIDSPGGSALAAEELWRRIRKVREEKPVVISMGNSAASGGYYVACAADAIVAQPATLTGSIGVFMLHPAIAGLYRKLDIRAEVISRGSFAAVASSIEPMTSKQRARAHALVQSTYQDFVGRVAQGRDMTREQVDRLGQGRVWLGATALEKGLVDAVGGLHAAVERAKEEAGIDPELDPERVIFPSPRPLSEQIIEIMRGELPASFVERLIPVRIPGILRAVATLAEGELALLPAYWLEIH